MAHEAQSRLRTAVLRRDVDGARRALDDGADVRQVDEYGFTPLGRAVFRGDVGVARLLLDRGADVRQADEHGHSALYYAVVHNSVAVARLLLRRGADICQGPDPCSTALGVARRKRENGEAPADSAAALIFEVDDLIAKGVWSPEAHYGLPEATRARAVELGLAGRLKFNRNGPPPDWWINRVIPFAI